MDGKYQKGSFSFPYQIEQVREKLERIFSTKNDYSWNYYESTMLLCLELECNLLEKEGTGMIFLSAALGLYVKNKPRPKKIDKAVKK